MRPVRVLAFACALLSACVSQPQAAADPPPAHASAPSSHARAPAAPARSAAPPPAVAASPVAGRDFPELPGRSRAQVLCGDGADMIVAAGEQKIYRVFRSHQLTESRGPRSPIACQVRGTGPSASLAVAGHGGEYARFDGSDWEFGLAPALDGEDLTGVILPSPNRVILVGSQRSMYTREGDTWTLQRYPSGGIDVVHAAADSSGTIYLVGAHGRLLAYASGTYRDLAVTGIPAEVLSSRWVSGWYSSRTHSLWAFAQRWTIRIELSSLRATVQKIPLFFDTESVLGTSTARGDLFTMMTFGDGAVYDGTTFYKLEARDHRGGGMYLDPVRATLYATGWDKLMRYSVKHPYLGTGQGEELKDR